MDLRLLGPLELRVGDRIVPLGGNRQQAVLALLAIGANRPVPSDRLIEGLWGERPPQTAVNTLQTYISRLRRVFGDAGDDASARLETRAAGYLLRAEADEIDLLRFEALLDAARRAMSMGDPEAAVTSYEQALSLWRGDPLTELDGAAAVAAETTRLAELRMAAIEERIDGGLALGHHRTLVAHLESVVAEHPLRERFWGQLMLALYRSGRQADALAAYHRARRTLVTELGIEPGPELRALEQQVLRQDPALASPASPASPAQSERPRHNLPAARTSFVGRAYELAQVRRLLGEVRVLTLTGAGGVGKTRLALEVAGALLDDQPDGVWFAPLETLADGDLVPQAVASALGVREQSGDSTTEVLAGAIADRRLLLLVDNCEHLIAACAELAESLLARCPGLHILATSREPLAISGETVWEVEPLSVPGDEQLPLAALRELEAVQLFEARARAAVPGLTLAEADAESVARITRSLDGLPLALELAATRVRPLGMVQVAANLEDRFRALREGARAAPRHQATLAATVDWSYRLLRDDEQRLFDRVGAFGGPFTLESAVAVCAGDGIDEREVIDLLSHLVEKSLVRRPVAATDAPRYRLLETLRQFARDRLAKRADADAVRDRHARHYLALAEVAAGELIGARQVVWLRRLNEDEPNLRAALEWAIGSAKADLALRLTIALSRYWELHDHSREGLDWSERVLAMDGLAGQERVAEARALAGLLAVEIADYDRGQQLLDDALEEATRRGDRRALAMVTEFQGWLAQNRGDYRRAREHYAGALSRYRGLGMRWHEGLALHHLGMVLAFTGDYEAAGRTHLQALEIAQELGDRYRTASELRMLAVVALDTGDHAAAEAHARAALAIYTDLDDASGVAHVTYTLGDIARQAGDDTRARPLYEGSLEQLRQLGDKRCVASTLRNLGILPPRSTHPAAAAALLRESLVMRSELGDQAGVAECFEGLAGALGPGDPERATELLAAADALRDQIGSVRARSEADAFRTQRQRLRSRLSADVFDLRWSAGLALAPEAATALALRP